MKIFQFVKSHPTIIIAIIIGFILVDLMYNYYAIKRNAYIAGCVAGSSGRMSNFQCWSIYHSTNYN